jgi:hypothetical protein
MPEGKEEDQWWWTAGGGDGARAGVALRLGEILLGKKTLLPRPALFCPYYVELLEVLRCIELMFPFRN